jgi:hypothetical protein
LLQGGRTLQTPELARQGDSAGLRAAKEPLPGHAGPMQRVQVDVHQHAGQSEVNVSSVQCTIHLWGNFHGKADQKQKMGIAFSRVSFFYAFYFFFNLIHLLVVWGGGAMGIL